MKMNKVYIFILSFQDCYFLLAFYYHAVLPWSHLMYRVYSSLCVVSHMLGIVGIFSSLLILSCHLCQFGSPFGSPFVKFITIIH